MLWTQMRGSILPANLLEKASTSSSSYNDSSYNSAGSWGLDRKEKCITPCLPCGSSQTNDYHPLDEQLMAQAKAPRKRGQTQQTGPPAPTPGSSGKVPNEGNTDSFCGTSLATLAPAHRLNRVGKSAQAGLTDRRLHPLDANIWRSFISSRRGYLFATKVMQRIITLFQNNESRANSSES